MEGESSWVVNGIITLALVPLLAPLAAPLVEEHSRDGDSVYKDHSPDCVRTLGYRHERQN